MKQDDKLRVWVRAYIGLGSNLGDRAAMIDSAVRRLEQNQSIRVVGRSRLYDTRPVGGNPDQPNYLNGVAAIDTALRPGDLLRCMQEVENELGRERAERWGARTIDLDLLLYGDEMIDEPGLTVPHPRMHERGFVLGPLMEIAPEARHPGFKMTVVELLQSLGGLRPV